MHHHGIPILDLEVVQVMAHVVRSITIDAKEILDVTWEERNAAGQVIERYVTRITRPPVDVRKARTGTDMAPVDHDPGSIRAVTG